MPAARVERIGLATLYLGDCAEILPSLDVGAVITDPPYGISAEGGTGAYGKRRGFSGGWDAAAPALDFLPDVPSIIWGGNYFPLRPSRCFLVWDKGAGFRGRDFAEAELAWCSLDVNARVFSYDPLAKGDYRGGRKMHPTQKPVSLMRWCVEFLASVPGAVADPFAGVGSTIVACQMAGRPSIGIERDPHYFDIMCKRVAAAAGDLSAAVAAAPGDQMALFG